MSVWRPASRCRRRRYWKRKEGGLGTDKGSLESTLIDQVQEVSLRKDIWCHDVSKYFLQTHFVLFTFYFLVPLGGLEHDSLLFALPPVCRISHGRFSWWKDKIPSAPSIKTDPDNPHTWDRHFTPKPEFLRILALIINHHSTTFVLFGCLRLWYKTSLLLNNYYFHM